MPIPAITIKLRPSQRANLAVDPFLKGRIAVITVIITGFPYPPTTMVKQDLSAAFVKLRLL